MSATRRDPVTVAALGALALLAGLLAVAAWNASVGFDAGALTGFLEKWSYNVVLVGASCVCILAGIARGKEYRVWLVLGSGMLLWSFGNVYYSVVLWDKAVIPVPSLSDAFWIAFYPCAYLSLLKLLRYGGAGQSGGLWLDGAVGGLAIAAAAAAFVFDDLLTTSGTDLLAVMTNVAYPVADTVLLMLTVVVLGLNGWRLQRTWLLLGLGFIAFAIIDSVYLVGVADGTWKPGNVGEAGWPLAMLLLAGASWVGSPKVERAQLRGMRLLLVPAIFAGIALWVLFYDHFVRVHLAALVLSTAAIAAVIARMAMTFRDNMRQLSQREHQAHNDPLTGLGNRRKLYSDMERFGESGDPLVLTIFDLNGFKDYNDRFGHPAGDALLALVGSRLAEAVRPHGFAYRLGGDEFCSLTRHRADEAPSVAARLAAAFLEQGDGFSISASYGWASTDGEMVTAEILSAADRRMYAHKHRGRATAARQTVDVLAKALSERNADLSHHLDKVAGLVRALAVRIGMSDSDVEETVRGAQLHDVGKVAVPDAILLKPGPLSESERAVVEQHTVMGERILSAAPALVAVGRLVRHSHERFDGGGYPDRLAGEEIPLGSRLIHVCDAFEAMTSDRPYKLAMSVDSALAELQRCSNTQFDGRIVDVFCELIKERDGASEWSDKSDTVRDDLAHLLMNAAARGEGMEAPRVGV